MPATAVLVWLPCLGLLLGLGGCGHDAADRAAFNRVQAACGSAVGLTVGQAAATLPGSLVLAATCTTDLAPTGAADVCGGSPGADYGSPVCTMAAEYCASSGSSLCGSGPGGGCAFACELRVLGTTPAAVTANSTICATRFVSHQAFTLLTHLYCP